MALDVMTFDLKAFDGTKFVTKISFQQLLLLGDNLKIGLSRLLYSPISRVNKRLIPNDVRAKDLAPKWRETHRIELLVGVVYFRFASLFSGATTLSIMTLTVMTTSIRALSIVTFSIM
jgi:hypothetical protein